MKKIMLVIAVFLFIEYVDGQNYKFGKVSVEELSENDYYGDINVHASVLYRNQKIYFEYVQGKGFMQKNEIHERVKIYSKKGFDYVTHIVKLYDEGRSDKAEKIIQLKAYTYNLNGTQIEKTKLKKEGVFNEVTNKYWRKRKFTLPNVKKGSVIEYHYIIESPFLQVGDIPFQAMIPIKKLDFKFTSPEYFGYKTLTNLKAAIAPDLKYDVKQSKIRFTDKYRTGYKTVKTHYENKEISLKENIIYSNMLNIPALKDESYVDNISNYQSKLVLELEYTKFPNETMEMLSSDWEKVTKTIYNNPDFGNQLKKQSYFRKDIDELLKGINKDHEKITAIFNHVKAKIKWNKINGYYVDLGVSKAYSENNGNTADINLALVSILRYAGFNANPVLVSTKNNGIPIIPTRTGFNYVICGIENNETTILLDASDEFSSINILPVKALNWLGRVIRKDGSSRWVDLLPKKHSEKNKSLNINLNSDFTATGKGRYIYKDYSALNFRNKYFGIDKSDLARKLEKDKSELEITNLSIKNDEIFNKSLTVTYDFKQENVLEQVGNKLYVSPFLFLATNENSFKENKRDYPIDFSYPFSERIMLSIKLPEGYEVESLPEQAQFVFGNSGSYTYLIKENGEVLQLVANFKLNTSIIVPQKYPDFKKFFQMYLDKQSEKIVLKKKL